MVQALTQTNSQKQEVQGPARRQEEGGVARNNSRNSRLRCDAPPAGAAGLAVRGSGRQRQRRPDASLTPSLVVVAETAVRGWAPSRPRHLEHTLALPFCLRYIIFSQHSSRVDTRSYCQLWFALQAKCSHMAPYGYIWRHMAPLTSHVSKYEGG